MAADSTDKANKRGRRWLCVRLLAWGLFLIWFGWFAYVRWTTPPAAQTRGMFLVEPSSARFAELASAANSLPAYNPGRSYPAWASGVAGFAQALSGEWDVEARSELADVVKYLNTPNVSQALDRCGELARELAETETTRQDLAALSGLGGGIYEPIEVAAAALTVRARLRHAGQGDLSGALADLQAATVIGAWGSRLCPWGPYFGHKVAVTELAHLAQEVDAPRAEAVGLLRLLSAECSLSVSQTLRAARIGGQTQALLDRHFTDDGRGNGWLVLSSMQSDLFGGSAVGSQPRSGFWNLFSPLFNDRRTVAAKLARLDEKLVALDGLDYDSIGARLTEQAGFQRGLSVLDGPLAEVSSALSPNMLAPLITEVAQRRAVVVMLALSVYKYEHGGYPIELAELVPDYLDEVPRDLVANAPFLYRWTAPGTYELRSARGIPGEIRFGWEGTGDAYSQSRPAARE